MVMMGELVEKRSLGSVHEILENTARELVEGIQALEVLATMTEDEFLYVGSQLEDFYGRSATMADLSKSAAEIVSGDEIRRTMDGLGNLVESVSAGLKTSESMTEVSLAKLRYIAELTEEVFLSLDDLKRVTRTLDMLGLSMIIQNASLTSPVGSLKALGEDVRKLSAGIDEKALQIAEETRSAAKSISNVISNLRTLQLTQQTKVAGILKKTQSGLSSLSEKYILSAGIVRDISEVVAEISASIGNIVTSTQVHDITRQQFESSVREFRALLSSINDGAGKEAGLPDEGDGRRLVHQIAQFCDRQNHALLRARYDFVSAAKEIIRSLRSLSTTTRTMFRKTLEVMGTESAADSTFLLRIESDLDSVREAFSAFSEAVEIGNEISRAIIVVARTAEKLAGFTDDVENIGDRVVLVALNAEIKAEGIGTEGRGLSVIAESVQRVSVDAGTCINAISHLLRSMTSTFDELSDAVVSTGGSEMPQEKELSKGLRDFIGSLHGLNGKVFPALGKCEEFGRNLSSDIDEVSGAIRVHESLDNVTEEILANLRKTGSVAGRMINADGEEKKDFRERIDRAGESLSFETGRPVAGGPSEFGDNVELF